MTKRQFLFICVLMVWSLLTASANDGVYFTSGNFLVPTQETDISVSKEILTITIGKDNYARVDVYYEFTNSGAPKTVTMAFEADAPYNSGEQLNLNGAHPFIHDFTVNMNGNTLRYDNAIVALFYNEGKPDVDFTPLDLTQWKGEREGGYDVELPGENMLYNARLDSMVNFAYAYYFKAKFQSGRNIVRHSYRYRMNYNVGERFSIPYWLTPATRWANRQIDDFTLNITTDEQTEFCLPNSMFRAEPFKSTCEGTLFQLTTDYGEDMLFAIAAPGDTVSWHARNFRPTAEMCIAAPIWDRQNVMYRCQTEAKVVIDSEGRESRYIADCGDSYFVDVQAYGLVKKKGSRVAEYSAEKGQGCLVLNSYEYQCVNVRQRPTYESPAIGQISDRPGEMPDVFPCLGLVNGEGKSRDWQWLKLKIDGKIGYVKQGLMLWDAIDSH